MDPVILLAIIAGVPVLLALLLRVSAVYLFLSVAAGSLIVTYVGDDAGFALGMFLRSQNSNQIAQFTLQLLPVALTILILRKTMLRRQFIIQIPVLIAVGLALAVLALPLLDSGSQQKVFDFKYGSQFKDSQDIIVATAASLSLLLMWLTDRHKEDKHKKKKH